MTTETRLNVTAERGASRANSQVTNVTDEKQSLMPRSATAFRARLGALAASGILFVLYPALRPFSDEASLQGAAAFASVDWIVAHVLAMLGFILLSLGLLGLYFTIRETPVERLAFRGLVLSWLGTGLTLPYYGAEVFGLHAIGQEALRQQNAALVSLANEVRFGPRFIMILTGLALLAVGTVLVALAVWKSGTLPKWSGTPLALAFLLYIPQYVGTQPIRVAHGLLVAAGCLWLAAGLWRQIREGGGHK